MLPDPCWCPPGSNLGVSAGEAMPPGGSFSLGRDKLLDVFTFFPSPHSLPRLGLLASQEKAPHGQAIVGCTLVWAAQYRLLLM